MSADNGLWIERSRESLRNKTTDALRRAISEGQFPAGVRLLERELCDLTGVSRTIIRESLRHLEAEGLVTTLPNKGPIVTTLTIDQVRQIYDVREALEPLAAKLFTENASDDAVAELKVAYAEMAEGFKTSDLKVIVDSARLFFRIIRDNCGNEFIAEFLNRLSTRIDFLRVKSMSRKDRLPSSLAEMQAIVTALENRDQVAAVAASASHVRAASASAMEVLKQVSEESDKSAPLSARGG